MADDEKPKAADDKAQEKAQENAAALEDRKQAYIVKRVAEANEKEVPGSAPDEWKPS